MSPSQRIGDLSLLVPALSQSSSYAAHQDLYNAAVNASFNDSKVDCALTHSSVVAAEENLLISINGLRSAGAGDWQPWSDFKRDGRLPGHQELHRLSRRKKCLRLLQRPVSNLLLQRNIAGRRHRPRQRGELAEGRAGDD